MIVKARTRMSTEAGEGNTSVTFRCVEHAVDLGEGEPTTRTHSVSRAYTQLQFY
jgi:hypothetical protein